MEAIAEIFARLDAQTCRNGEACIFLECANIVPDDQPP